MLTSTPCGLGARIESSAVILAGKMASSELRDATRGGRTDIEEKHKPWEIASTLRHADVLVSWGRSAAEAV